jgi:hypothetical protein
MSEGSSSAATLWCSYGVRGKHFKADLISPRSSVLTSDVLGHFQITAALEAIYSTPVLQHTRMVMLYLQECWATLQTQGALSSAAVARLCQAFTIKRLVSSASSPFESDTIR